MVLHCLNEGCFGRITVLDRLGAGEATLQQGVELGSAVSGAAASRSEEGKGSVVLLQLELKEGLPQVLFSLTKGWQCAK